MTTSTSKTKYRALLNDICQDYCTTDHYCILKEFIEHSQPAPRLLMQMKCVEKYKYEQSQSDGRELSWSEAMHRWIEVGYAQKFATLFDEHCTFRDLYKALMAP